MSMESRPSPLLSQPASHTASDDHPRSPHSPLSIDTPDHQPSSGVTHALPIEYPPGMAPPRSRIRRSSVSAESDRPSLSLSHKKIKIPKNQTQISRIQAATRSSILFSGLDADQQQEIIDAMSELTVRAGDVIIEQNEPGDYFYIIDTGIYDVYRDDVKVFEYCHKGSFGELALMYNCPRAATVKSRMDGCLWRVDRETFRHIVIQSTAKKRQLLEQSLESVPLLANLSRQERSLVADSLETINYHSGDYIIKQGEIGDSMYFIIKGEAKATQSVNGREVEVGRLHDGDYFGERSLLTREPRAANVVAVSAELQVAEMDRSAFERLLGSVKDVMHRHVAQYKKAEQFTDTDAQSMVQQQSHRQPHAAAAGTSTTVNVDGDGRINDSAQ